MNKKRLLFVVNEDQYFISHRLYLAKLAIDNGYKVGLLCNVKNYRQAIESSGIELFGWGLSRSSINPLDELKSVIRLFKTISYFSPDIVHAVTLKSVVYSAIVSKFKPFRTVYALAGLGHIFVSRSVKAYLLRFAVSRILRTLIDKRGSITILQNPDDKKCLVDNNIVNNHQVRLIRGAGVDTDHFLPSKSDNQIPLIILPARMLWDKGVGEFVKCAELINTNGIRARFALVGDIDQGNPGSLTEAQLTKWNNTGVVEWWGFKTTMKAIYQQADIVCFPSTYGEGLPKSLLEAASCALPIVAFDIPGCREIVIDSVNGFLVEAKNQDKLCEALEKLLGNKQLRQEFGKAGRELVISNFSQEQVGAETLQVWSDVLS